MSKAKEREQGRPSEEAIAKRAYEIYLQRGSQAGSEVDDWLQAEAELIAEANAAGDGRDEAPALPSDSEVRPEVRRPGARDRNNHRRAQARS